MGYTIFTKDNCPWCVKAKDLLKSHNVEYDEIHIPNDLTREEFYVIVESNNTTKTVPKIFCDDVLIGGYEDLADWFDNHAGGYGEGGLAK
jgi:thioredoxin reductase (NADPH)